ncbi:unnamed protein product [[Candida] boidinii]|uniref:Unnamed protein product n=1 Tax=Candida boidinii TaxID=5477 RepID=A0ACB5TEI5_CANBO|nr:unnamed protein product [[Candida] boidinii]
MAVDSFFTDPSKKKRKRSGRQSSLAPRGKDSNKKSKSQREKHNSSDDEELDEEEIASDIFSEDSDAEKSKKHELENEREDLDSDEEFAGETAADKRRRLAKQYLENLKQETENYDFDAKDLDDEIIASRLQKDVAEQQGHVYKFIADELLLSEATPKFNRMQEEGITSLSVKYPNVYVTSKDMVLSKWDFSETDKKPKRTKYVKGGLKYLELSKEQMYNGHCDQISCVTTSPDGRYVVTGGKDKRIIVWSTENLAPIRVLEIRDRRGQVLGLTFRRNTDNLYASCADLKIRTYSINQLAQLETLYGHQDLVVDISALSQERCVTVGSRDRTAMYWKIAEETRLTFRGGDSQQKPKKKKKKENKDETEDIETTEDKTNKIPYHAEGSIDCVSMIDDSHFVTGSDNGNIALWSLAKKKHLYVERCSHGILPVIESTKASGETNEEDAKLQIPEPQPYWITAIHAVPYSNVFISGSWNGDMKVWKLDEHLRRFELIGTLPNVRGIVTRIDSYEDEKNSKLVIFASVSKEHRLGRWIKPQSGSRNGLYSIAIDLQKL